MNNMWIIKQWMSGEMSLNAQQINMNFPFFRLFLRLNLDNPKFLYNI